MKCHSYGTGSLFIRRGKWMASGVSRSPVPAMARASAEVRLRGGEESG